MNNKQTFFHDFLIISNGANSSAAERFALPALGRAAERRPTGKMPRRRKLLEIYAESPASGARFVGQVLQDGFDFALIH